MVRLIMTKLIMAMLVMVMSINVMLIKVMLIICISIGHDHGDVTHNEVDHGNGHLPQALLQVVLLLLQLLDPLLVAQLHPGHGGVNMIVVMLLVMLIAHLAMMVSASWIVLL